MDTPTVDALRAVLPPPEGREAGWTDECGACQDTGWEIRQCHGGERAFCGRRTRHAAHTYAETCSCRPTNRTFQRHQEAQRSRRS